MELRPRNLLVFRCLLATWCLTVGLLAAPAEADVVKVRLGVQSDRTRVVLDLDAPATYRIEPQVRPDQVVIVLAGARFLASSSELPAAGGFIKAMRVGEAAGAASTLILELTGPAHAAQAQFLHAAGATPARIFVDLRAGSTAPVEPAGAEQVASLPKHTVQLASTEAVAVSDASTATEPAASDLLIPPVKPAQLEAEDEIGTWAAMLAPAIMPPQKPAAAEGQGIPVIVIDAGHGGKDPGAVGAKGTMEKDVNLRMARELKALLEATGRYKVVLTRTDDRLLALRQRIEIAREAQADLFVSVHADHSDNTALRGASVYTLSETASDTEAAAVAARENKEDLIAGVDLSSQSAMVTSILIDLAQRETKNLSARFASLLTDELAERTLVLRDSHRFAGFVVLKALDVPSVLLELGYLSNSQDEAALNSKRHRKMTGKAIRDAIDGFFEWQRDVRRS